MIRGKIRELEGIERLLGRILEGKWKEDYPLNCIMISVNEKVLRKYLQTHSFIGKDSIKEFDGVQLLAYIALRSIIGPQKYKAIKWDYILSRMAGERKMIDNFPAHVMPYKTRRKRNKLIKALMEYWGLHYYAPQREIRVPLFSFVLDEKALMGKKQKRKSKKCTP